MGYLHINNLYKEQVILLFKRCFALEKIHGTSAHVTFTCNSSGNWEVRYFSGGESHEKFVSLFDTEKLIELVKLQGYPIDRTITIYGEAYGGKCQKMSNTYGLNLKFIAFDVQFGDCWLNVPDACEVVTKLGLEFVHYVEVSTDLAELDAQRDSPSVQAVRNGIVNPMKREGVVLRPLMEMTMNNGNRIICKHKGDDFKETATPRPVVDPSKMKVIEDAKSIANEWVTPTRLEHVLDKIPNHGMDKMRDVINAMTEDVLREGAGEIVDAPAVRKSISTKTVELYKNFLKAKMTA